MSLTTDSAYYRVHSRRRAGERPGVKLTRNERSRVLNDIAGGRAVYCGPVRLSSPKSGRVGREKWGVKFAAGWFGVIVCPERRSIVTVLSKLKGFNRHLASVREKGNRAS